MAPVGLEQVRRRAFAQVPAGRSLDMRLAAAFRRGWHEDARDGVPLPTIGREPGVLAPPEHGRAADVLGHQRDASAVPAHRPAAGDRAEAAPLGMLGSATDAGLAGPSVAPSRAPALDARFPSATPASHGVGRSSDAEQGMEPAALGDQLAPGSRPLTRPWPAGRTPAAAEYRALILGALTKCYADGPRSLQRVSRLLRDFGMNARTAVTKSSKWKCYVEFCVDDGLHPLPTTEAHLLGYIGWLAE